MVLNFDKVRFTFLKRKSLALILIFLNIILSVTNFHILFGLTQNPMKNYSNKKLLQGFSSFEQVNDEEIISEISNNGILFEFIDGVESNNFFPMDSFQAIIEDTYEMEANISIDYSIGGVISEWYFNLKLGYYNELSNSFFTVTKIGIMDSSYASYGYWDFFTSSDGHKSINNPSVLSSRDNIVLSIYYKSVSVEFQVFDDDFLILSQGIASRKYMINAIRLDFAHSIEYVVGKSNLMVKEFKSTAIEKKPPLAVRIFGFYFIPLYILLLAGVIPFSIIRIKNQKVKKQLQKSNLEFSSYTFEYDS